MKGSGDFSIGSKVCPGTSKLIEETGELQQVLGKLIATAGDMNHWSGDLREKLIEEIGGVMAAIEFFINENMIQSTQREIYARAQSKLALFRKWHTEGRGPENNDPVAPEIKREGKLLFLPVVLRNRSPAESQELDAATEWLLAELGEPVTLEALRQLAVKETWRPRDALHKRWAECFLKETEGYEK